MSSGTIYLATEAGGLYAWTVATGSLRFVGNMGVQLTDIAFDPEGRLYGISFNSLWQVDPLTAETQLVGRLRDPLPVASGTLSGANGFDISSDGVALISSNNNRNVVEVDLATGAVSTSVEPLLGSGQATAGDIWIGENRRYWLTTDNGLLVEAQTVLDERGNRVGRDVPVDSEIVGSRLVYGLVGTPEWMEPPSGAFLIGFTGTRAHYLGGGRDALGPGFATLALDSDVYGAARARRPDPGTDGLYDEQEIALLYEVAFARQPDLPGLNFWINKVYGEDGFSVVQIAEAFYFIDAFEQALGRDPDTFSDAEIVEALYANVLDRPGLASQNDPAGYQFWLGAVQGGLSRPELIREFAVSPENVANAAYVNDLAQQADGGWVF